MIGNFLNQQLSVVGENMVLTTPLAPGHYVHNDKMCLVGAYGREHVKLTNILTNMYARKMYAQKFGEDALYWLEQGESVSGRHMDYFVFHCAIESRFDLLCRRFGTERIARAIRNRILNIQARRALSSPRPAETSTTFVPGSPATV